MVDDVLGASAAGYDIGPMAWADIPAVIDGIGQLLRELTGDSQVTVPPGAADVCERMLAGSVPGAVFLAVQEPDGREPIGVVTVSVQESLRTGGPYALIQELWAHPAYRSRGVGEALIERVVSYCQDHHLSTIEVGLPGADFPGLARTQRFYRRVGFVDLGPRMRRKV